MLYIRLAGSYLLHELFTLHARVVSIESRTVYVLITDVKDLPADILTLKLVMCDLIDSSLIALHAPQRMIVIWRRNLLFS